MWPEWEVQKLRQLWAEGLTASQVARELGTGRSRNAIIGKLSRIGAPQRAQPTRSMGRPRKAPQPATPRKRAPPRPPAQAGAPTLREALILSLPPLEPARQIGSIGDRECRFICGDPRTDAHAFCARPTIAHGAWCKHHRWLVSAPSIRHREQQRQGAGV